MSEEIKDLAVFDDGVTGIAKATDYIKVFDQIKTMAARVLRPQNIINQAGKPYIDDNGCCAIANLFGIRFSSPTITLERDRDEAGERLDYYAEGEAEWHGRTVSDIGCGSSRDEFFGQRRKPDGTKYWLPLSEVDRPSIRKKAITNLHARLTKRLLGLNYTWEELREYAKIGKEGTAKVEYRKPAAPKPATQSAPPVTAGKPDAISPKPQASSPTPPPPPSPTPSPAHEPGKITENQAKRLYAIAKAAGWQENGVKEYLASKGYTSSKNIDIADYDEIIDYLQNGGAV